MLGYNAAILRQLSSPSIELLNAISSDREKMLKSLNNIAAQVVLEQSSYINIAKTAAAQMTEIQRTALATACLMSDLSNAFVAMKKSFSSSLITAIQVENQFIKELANLSLPLTQTLVEEYWRIQKIRSEINQFAMTFGGQLLLTLEKSHADRESAIDSVDEVEDLVSSKVGMRQPTIITREGLLQIVLSVSLFFYGAYRQDKANKAILDRVDQFETKIIKDIETQKIAAIKPNSLHYVTTRLKLRKGPSKKFSVIRTLLPKTLVLVEAMGNGWCQVRAFDFVSGEPAKGWVFGRYLKPVGSTK